MMWEAEETSWGDYTHYLSESGCNRKPASSRIRFRRSNISLGSADETVRDEGSLQILPSPES